MANLTITEINITWLYEGNVSAEKLICGWNTAYSNLAVYFVMIALLFLLITALLIRNNSFSLGMFVGTGIIMSASAFLYFVKENGCSLISEGQLMTFIAFFIISGSRIARRIHCMAIKIRRIGDNEAAKREYATISPEDRKKLGIKNFQDFKKDFLKELYYIRRQRYNLKKK